ncbi:MAG: hypothetical protein COA79_21170 [Planctomycetota bacterium]|nr:MAG: hypothetical protein COA79_21170 [Planctomycetota bacterium]
MVRLIIDFETYYSKTVSLKKMSYEEYIAHPQFEVQMIGWKDGDNDAESGFDVSEILAELQVKYGQNLENVCIVAHNALFDIFVLSRVYNINPPKVIDTLQMARHAHGVNQDKYLTGLSLKCLADHYGLNPKGDLEFMEGNACPTVEEKIELQRYCENDVSITAKLLEILLPKVSNVRTELLMMNHTIQSFISRGITVDKNKICKMIEEQESVLKNLLIDLKLTREEVTGNKSFKELLTNALNKIGQDLPTKQGKKGLIPATAKDDPQMLVLCDHSDPFVSKLTKARLMVKSFDTSINKAKKLVKLSSFNKGKLCPNLKYYGAGITGRFAGVGYNLQNQGRDGIGLALRNSLIASSGKSFVIADLNAIEARVLAWLSGQKDLIQLFELNKDPYSVFASEKMFNRAVYKPTDDDPNKKELKLMRNAGKTAVLGLGYGMGCKRFYQMVKDNEQTKELVETGVINKAKSKEIVDTYRNTMSNIKNFWFGCEQAFEHALESSTSSTCNTMVFDCVDGDILVTLPSSRKLRYSKPEMIAESKTVSTYNRQGKDEQIELSGTSIYYGKGIGLYGGKLVENIVQATARDILVHIILTLEQKGIQVLFHVHDEVICEVDNSQIEKAERIVQEVMSTPPTWAKGLPLATEIEISRHYLK